ncbi:hypothetical protein EV421DRAFT_1913616 [Armillaria borealis]|uniref:Uncharacterized protein n=1 Tax=Armillaria borealis TaxID=47425 RepID=A0AA39MDX1_9AGAR|nr:hypothetical protein EV421DRAFT_1913616 [Armillaria borealis]
MSSNNCATDKSNQDGYHGLNNTALNKATESETVHLWNQFYWVLCDPSKRPSMGDDPILWLTELHDIVSLMSDTELPAVIHELGDSHWCQLVFLNVCKTTSHILVKTKVVKIDITNWDLIPQEADIPCKTCFKKWPCHYTNSSDQWKCQECHIQAKKCISSPNFPTIPRKRKHESEHIVDRSPILAQPSPLLAPRPLCIKPKSGSSSPVPRNTSEEQSMSPTTSCASPDDRLIPHDDSNVEEVHTMEHVMQSLRSIEDQHSDESRLALYRIWKHRLLLGHNKNITDLVELLNKFRVELASAMEQFGTI